MEYIKQAPDNIDLTTLEHPKGWYPLNLHQHQGQLCISWGFLPEAPYRRAFFFDTIQSIPKTELKYCKLESLQQFQTLDCLAPSAFIFHTSRCGSTLLTQQLTELAECLAPSEPPIFDDALNYCRSLSDEEQKLQLLRSVIRALGQRQTGKESHLFIKLDCWHIADLPLIRKAFPATPFILLYRTPKAVFDSHKKQRGLQMVPGLINSQPLDMDSESVPVWDLDRYCLKVMRAIYRLFISYAPLENQLLLNYQQLPEFTWRELAAQFNLPLTEQKRQQMAARSTHHSKQRHNAFKTPQPAPENPLSPALRQLEIDYQQLEHLRIRTDKERARYPANPDLIP